MALLLLLSLACGGPRAGDLCNQPGATCESTTRALECRGGAWVAIPCRGPGGCTVSSELVNCDFTGAQVGDACGTPQEDKGVCAPDGRATLVCRNGTFQMSMVCRTCTVSGATISCQP